MNIKNWILNLFKKVELKQDKQWISVKDELPELHENVLIYRHNTIYISFLYNENKANKNPISLKWYQDATNLDKDEPTHWMPLPNSPKE